MVVNEDLSYPTGGIYLEIVPDERLVFRWGAVGGWPELDGKNELTAPVVTVQLNDVGKETELILTVRFSEPLPVRLSSRLLLQGSQDLSASLSGWGVAHGRRERHPCAGAARMSSLVSGFPKI